MSPVTTADPNIALKLQFLNRSEFDLVRRLAMRRTGPAEAAEIVGSASREIDWACFLQDARYHRVRPLLYAKLRDLPDEESAPEFVRNALREEYEANAQRSEPLADELVAILNQFKENGVPGLPFKGPALGYAAFPEAAQRDTANLDVLVGPRGLARARQVLLARGYRFKPFSKFMGEEAQWHIEGNVRFLNRERGFEICVHCQIVPRRYGHRTSFERMWKRARPLALPAGTVAGFSPEDGIIILCLHAIKNGFWPTLKLVCDLSQIIGGAEKMDWTLLLQEARRVHCERIVLLGLTLANKLLDAPLPRELLAHIDADAAVPGIRDWVAKRFREREAGFEHLIDASSMHAKLRKHASEKARYLYYVIATPSERDFELMGKPVSVPQAYAIRFAGLAKKFATQFIGKIFPGRKQVLPT